jgi:hypothetical protein
MSKFFSLILFAASGALILTGFAILPTYVWIYSGSKPLLGWIIYLSGILVPWALAYLLIRWALILRKAEK